MEKKGFIVNHASNGKVAFEIFRDSTLNEYDIILMDIRMPIMDGLESTKLIRGLEREDAKTIPIIAMTANVFKDDIQKSKGVGMNAHLAKPMEPTKLVQLLSDVFMRKENIE